MESDAVLILTWLSANFNTYKPEQVESSKI